jgi:hypothetical protein
MGSSFLTTINVVLALYSLIVFFKSLIQFGLPNHPARFTLYLVSLCAVAYFAMKALAGLGYISPIDYLRWRTIPVVGSGLGILLQVVTSVGNFSRIQQKMFSRIPLIGALLVFAFFPPFADHFFGLCILATVLFLSVSVGKARYQKRILFKMTLFLVLSLLLTLMNFYWTYVVGELLLFPALFYFFIFEQSYGVAAMMERHAVEN